MPYRRSEHITLVLISLHWLCIPECISFKLAVLTDIPINPQHFTYLPAVVFHPCRRHDSKMTAAVSCLSLSRSTARLTLYSQQMGVPSGIQTASQDFPLLSFLPGHPYMTYLLSLIITIGFSYFPGISRGPWNTLGHSAH